MTLLSTKFTHPGSFMGLTEPFAEAVAAAGFELTGEQATGWNTSPDLILRNQIRYFATVWGRGIIASYSVNVTVNRQLSDPDEIGRFKGDDGWFGFLLEVDGETDPIALEATATTILGALGATVDDTMEVSDEPHPDARRELGGDETGGIIAKVPPTPADT